MGLHPGLQSLIYDLLSLLLITQFNDRTYFTPLYKDKLLMNVIGDHSCLLSCSPSIQFLELLENQENKSYDNYLEYTIV